MTREQAKELLPIIKAFAEGKTIQSTSKCFIEPWVDEVNKDCDFDSTHYQYRIKPTYRPFKNAYEGWQEIQKPNTPWKSVNDELPPVDEEVIALDETGRITFAHIVDKAIAIDYEGWNIPCIAFWMPYTPSREMEEFYEDE